MANRYWVGSGSSQNWNATGNTNWGTASGTQDNASVPTSTDDVIFDGAGTNGNDSSTISATITVKSLTITTGYTATMTHNAVLTIAGNWTYVNTYTIAGTSGITLSATSTITSNGVTWPNGLTLTNTTTYTLSGNLTVNGLLTVSGTSTVNKTASETLTLAGGITASSQLSGTASKIILTGGTWSGSGRILNINIDFNGNVTISGTVSTGDSIITYVSGTITTTGSTYIPIRNTLNTNGITWNNISFDNTQTSTLTSNLSIGGLLTISATTILNKTTTETCTVTGGITVNANLSGTAKIILTGGTWSGGLATLESNTDINGNVTLGTNVYYGTGTLTYVSGTITVTSSTLNITIACTLNLNGLTLNNFRFYNSITATLTSNLSVNGLMTVSAATTLNKTASETCTVAGGITVNAAISGTAKIVLTGGTWSSNGNAINNNLDIQGNVTVSSTVYYATGTLTYISGTVTTTASTLRISSSCTLNTNGILWNNFSSAYGSGITITLTSNLTVSDTFINGGYPLTINKTASEVVNIYNLTTNSSTSGTVKFILNGGNISNGSSLSVDFDLNGNYNVTGIFYLGGTGKTYKYLNGVISINSLNIWGSGLFVDLEKVYIKDLTFANQTDFTLLSNLSIYGLLSCARTGINGSFNIFCYGGFKSILNYNTVVSSSISIYLNGGVWDTLYGYGIYGGNIYINGNITISGNVYYQAGTLTYLSGRVNSSNGTLNITAAANVNGFNKCPIRAVVITGGITVTMDRFFTGTPQQICSVTSTGSNYNIVFTDGFERMGKYVNVSNCTLARPLQLLIFTNTNRNFNRGNLGVRYINSSPNGVARNRPPIDGPLTGTAGLMQADPCFQK